MTSLVRSKKLYEIQRLKLIVVCGDFNIDLLKSDEHKKTAIFVNNMFSLSLYPLIIKPSRIKRDSATLIDNIFVNSTGKIIKSDRYRQTDISYHLPVFAVLESREPKQRPNETNRLVRLRTPEAIEAFELQLTSHNWQEVYVNNINSAYNAFLEMFMLFYNQHCPVKELRLKANKIRKAWITNGLEKACKRKNQLYIEYIKHQTKDKEDKYKKCKNNLTAILRQQKQYYYSTLLHKYKTNMKATWGVIREVLEQHKCKSFPTHTVREDGSVTDNIQEIENIFINFFVSISPNLAKEIP